MEYSGGVTMIVYTVTVTDQNGYNKTYSGTDQNKAVAELCKSMNENKTTENITIEYNARKM